MAIYRVPVEIGYSDPGSPGVNVWHVRTEESWMVTTSQLQAAVDAIHAFYADVSGVDGLGTAIHATGTTFTLGQVVEVTTQEAAEPTWTDLTAVNSGEDAPSGLAICVTWRTSLVARRGRGRTFLGPLNKTVVDAEGRISTAARTAVLTAADALVTASDNVNGWAVGVYGLDVSGSGPQGARVLRDITGNSVGSTFAMLRSRRD